LCCIAIAISKAHSFRQFNLIFFRNKITSSSQRCTNRQPIPNLYKILWKYKNSTKKKKFHGLARNSKANRKLWALVINLHHWSWSSGEAMAREV